MNNISSAIILNFKNRLHAFVIWLTCRKTWQYVLVFFLLALSIVLLLYNAKVRALCMRIDIVFVSLSFELSSVKLVVLVPGTFKWHRYK